MAFLENLGKKVEEAAQAAVKKSGELVETTKINMAIGTEEDKIQKMYAEIGKLVYSKYTSNMDVGQDAAALCESIKACEETIKGLKEKIMEIKKTKLCVNCGAELDRTVLFCSKCGAKQEEKQHEV